MRALAFNKTFGNYLELGRSSIMLKLTYTESGLHLEQLDADGEVWVTQRVISAMRSRQPLIVEPSRAAFLLAAAASELADLQRLLGFEQGSAIALVPIDREFVEVSLEGSWLAESSIAEEGMFLASLSDAAEQLVCQLWQVSQLQLFAAA
jgi:hypothetical protein